MSEAPRVSIVMPTFNGMRTLPRVFEAVRAQEAVRPVEIVAVDSGSTDGTTDFLEQRGAAVVRVAHDAFNHGTTRNLGVRSSRGDLVVLLVQDAIPSGSEWLAQLIEPFGRDAATAGTFARQQPHADASALTRWALSHWRAATDTPRVVGPLTTAEWRTLTPAERHDVCVFDNVCSCIRRSAWNRHPFAHVALAEDLEWARDVLLDGWRLAFVPSACVRHSHERSAAYELRRTKALHQRLFELFELSTIPTAGVLARSIVMTMATHGRVARSDGTAAVIRGLSLGIAWPLGQYLGARGARRSAIRMIPEAIGSGEGS